MKQIFIDTETSHFRPTGALLQVSGFIEIDNVQEEEFNFKLRPYGDEEWAQSAIDKTGIDEKVASSFENPHKVFEQFIKMLDKYVNRFDKQDKFFLIAYNASFDTDYLRNWFLRESKTDKDRMYGNGFGGYFWTPSIDVMQLAAIKTMKNRHLFPNFQLGTVCQMLGLEWNEEEAHDALYDIRKTRELYYYLKGRKTNNEIK